MQAPLLSYNNISKIRIKNMCKIMDPQVPKKIKFINRYYDEIFFYFCLEEGPFHTVIQSTNSEFTASYEYYVKIGKLTSIRVFN